MSDQQGLLGARWAGGARLAVALVLGVLPAVAPALDWTFSPFASVTETWSDNIDLEPEDEAESGFLTTLSPGFAVSGSGARLQADLGYSLSAVIGHGGDDSGEIFHNLNGDARAEMVERILFLDLGARASQSIEDLREAGGSDLTAGNDDLTQNYGVTVAPRLENRLGRFADSSLRYAHERVWFEDDDGDERAHTADWSLTSGPMFQFTRWSAQASYEDVESTDDSATSSTDGTLAETSFTLRQALTPRFEVNATGGYEENDLGDVDEASELSGDQDGAFWDVGIRWRPTRRLTLEAGGGERFFGRSLRGRLDYQGRRLALNISYSESLADNRSLVLTEQARVPVFSPDCPAGVEGCTPVGERLVFRTDSVDGFFISRQLRSTLSLGLQRSTVVLSGFRRVEEFQTGEGDERQVGASLDWIVSLGERTDFSTGGRYVREEFDEDDRRDDLWSADLTLSRRIGDALTIQASYRRQRQNSSDEDGEFAENAAIVSAALRY